MPTVHVRHFAQLREHRGLEIETVEVPPGTTLENLFELLFPDQAQAALSVGFALHHHLVSPNTVLEDGAEVAFLPPFGGG